MPESPPPGQVVWRKVARIGVLTVRRHDGRWLIAIENRTYRSWHYVPEHVARRHAEWRRVTNAAARDSDR